MFKPRMNYDLVQPFRANISILLYLGLWRLDNKWESLYRIYSYTLHFCFTILTTASMWASVFTSKEFEQITESLHMALTEAVFLPKYINMLRLSAESVNFLTLFDLGEFSLKNLEELTLFKKSHYVFYRVIKCYCSSGVGVYAACFTVVAFGKNWVLPYPAWMPFDLHSQFYWYAYFFQLIGLTVTTLSHVSIDVLQLFLLHHISLVYRVIGMRLSKIGFDLTGASNPRDVHELVMTDLREIIKIHGFIKRVTQKCEKFMSFPFFMQVLLSALVLCFSGYQTSSISPRENPGQFLAMGDFLVVIGIQMFLPCYYGNQVTIESGKLSEALYNSNWIDLPERSKKVIRLYMEFLKEPVYVKAGKFFDIGLPTFGKTINNAYSYFALLLQMNN